MEVAATAQRKRYYSFDADIYKVSSQLSKNISSSVSTSVKWQLEKIDQFGAIASKDNDNFTIGSLTPSVSYDRRDDQINPRKGVYLSLSSEWANHYFGSMKDTDFEVNYIKVVARNKFYIPMGNFVLATSIATGFEKNYAEKFYIPSIKVFRLDGFDEIRGFEDGEINRLTDGRKLSDVTVYDSSYFVAFKFEPRYNLTDNVQLDVFFDAGRVFVDQFQPLNLRTSVGAGFKFLTPVGSLDFDYGIKINRKTYADQSREAMGRFHLSIGFF
jgi:outer membrane protein insertion porin family